MHISDNLKPTWKRLEPIGGLVLVIKPNFGNEIPNLSFY